MPSLLGVEGIGGGYWIKLFNLLLCEKVIIYLFIFLRRLLLYEAQCSKQQIVESLR